MASERLVDLIETASRGESDQVYKLIGLLNKVFKEERLEGLPLISGTYRKTVEKLKEKYIIPALFYELSTLYSSVVPSSPHFAKVYLAVFALAILFYFLRKIG